MDRETLRLLAITAAVIYAVFQLVHWRRRESRRAPHVKALHRAMLAAETLEKEDSAAAERASIAAIEAYAAAENTLRAQLRSRAGTYPAAAKELRGRLTRVIKGLQELRYATQPGIR
jgi:predicted membrane metal-binding protein